MIREASIEKGIVFTAIDCVILWNSMHVQAAIHHRHYNELYTTEAFEYSINHVLLHLFVNPTMKL